MYLFLVFHVRDTCRFSRSSSRSWSPWWAFGSLQNNFHDNTCPRLLPRLGACIKCYQDKWCAQYKQKVTKRHQHLDRYAAQTSCAAEYTCLLFWAFQLHNWLYKMVKVFNSLMSNFYVKDREVEFISMIVNYHHFAIFVLRNLDQNNILWSFFDFTQTKKKPHNFSRGSFVPLYSRLGPFPLHRQWQKSERKSLSCSFVSKTAASSHWCMLHLISPLCQLYLRIKNYSFCFWILAKLNAGFLLPLAPEFL